MIKLLALLLTSAKFGKIAFSLGSMLLSIFAYALLFGWRFAVGFVALMFCHELGHYIAARKRGLAVGLPTFIPFVGAWIQLKDLPHDAETEAYVGLGGPLLGTIASGVVFYLGMNYDSPLLIAISYSGFFLNLFNLIPVPPFDGGRITAVLGPKIWFLGVPILVAFFLWRPSPLLLVFALLAAPQIVAAWRHDPKDPQAQAYYGVSNSVRWQYGAWYLALASILALMAYDSHNMMQTYTRA
jgi:Zn-dependent protease